MRKIKFNWEKFSHNRFNHLLIVIVILFVSGPFFQIRGAHYYMPIFPLVYLIAVLAILRTMVDDNVKYFLFSGLKVFSFILDLFARYHPSFSMSHSFHVFDQIVQMVFFMYFILHLFVLLFKMKNVSSDTVKGGICVYLFLGYFWAIMYRFLYDIDAESFSGHFTGMQDFVYFSFTTLTTIGYGDFVPLTSFAKMLTSFEGLVGQLFLTVFVAKLVGLHIVQNYNKQP